MKKLKTISFKSITCHEFLKLHIRKFLMLYFVIQRYEFKLELIKKEDLKSDLGFNFKPLTRVLNGIWSKVSLAS